MKNHFISGSSGLSVLIATQLFSDNVEDRSTVILDAGCGTGLVGEHLRRHGYKNIERLDYSRAMLEKAGQKQIYRKLTQGDLTGSLTIASNKRSAPHIVSNK